MDNSNQMDSMSSQPQIASVEPLHQSGMGSKQKQSLFKLLFLLIALPLSVFLVSKLQVFIFPKAAASPATLKIVALPKTTPATYPMAVNLITQGNVSYARTIVLFDKTRFQLSGEVTTTPLLKTVNEVTPMAEANTTGQIIISVSLATSDRANPPTGTISIATLPFVTTWAGSNELTNVRLDVAASQIVDPNLETAVITALPLDVVINPTVTPAPTATPIGTILPTATPSPIPTIKPTATPIITPIPTPKPTATPSPVPTPTPVVTPVPTIKPTSTPSPLPTPIVPGTGSVYTPGSSADFMNQDGANSSSTNIWLGTGASTSNSYLGLRLSGTSIPRGTRINSAQIQFASASQTWIPVSFQVYGERSPLPGPFVQNALPGARTQTIARLDYSDNVSWQASALYGYDVTSIIQELVNQSDTGTFALIFKGTGSAYGRKFLSSAIGQSPRLVINVNTSATPIITPRPSVLPTPRPTPAPSDAFCSVYVPRRPWFVRFFSARRIATWDAQCNL